LGLPKPLADAGYNLVDPGRYQPLSDDFSNQIAAFREANCEIVTGVMIPPDFGTFWAQSAQQGFAPKVVTVGKALLFPTVIDSYGDRADGLTSEVWWSPNHPFNSSLTGTSAAELANGYTAATGRPWTQPIGFRHALFEVAADVISRAEDLEDPMAITAAIAATNLDTIVGKVDWSSGPVPNVSKTPLVGGQWQKEGDTFDLKIVANSAQPDIPLTGDLKLI
ncbi:MAG: ABC transporter substrate-binding protein, partial [Paracoccaceae bacterium]